MRTACILMLQNESLEITKSLQNCHILKYKTEFKL